ncbi:MAG: hypothetical protein D6781_13905 [Verrucomicrobia bacterium]|nr:MAG: hypothetical protein D6781_13905 [Verrucomicrobiota bacterium]
MLENLTSRLPGLTESDFQFVRNCAADMVRHLCRSSGRSHDEVMAALREAGLPMPDPFVTEEPKADNSKDGAAYAGEGTSVQAFR